MTWFESFLPVIIAAAITENLLFARALGVNKSVTRSGGYRGILRFGGLFLFAVTLGGLFAWEVFHWIENISWRAEIRGFMVLLCVCSAYFIMIIVIGLDKVTGVRSLPVAVAFNSASFGAVFVAAETYTDLPSVLLYCIGGAVGMTFAMLLVHSGRERLEISRVPKAFAGMPITMVYIGILSLAFYGLLGYRLTT